MNYKGDIILVKFPFTNLKNFKKRPVLVIKDENELGDIICFQITSNKFQTKILKIENHYIEQGNLIVESFVKYDKCFTISNEVTYKKLAKVNNNFLSKLENLFCKEVF